MNPSRSPHRHDGLTELFGHVFAQRGILAVIVPLSLVGAGISLAQPTLIGQVIDRTGKSEPLGTLPWLVGGLLVLGGILGGVLQYLIQRTAEGAIRSSRHRLIDHLLRLPIPYLDRSRIGDLVSRVSNDTTTIRNMLSHGFIQSVAGVFTLIGALISMFLIDPVLLGIAAVTALSAVIIVVLVTQRIEKASIGLQNALGGLTASVDRALRAVRTVRAANATAHEANRVKADADATWRVGLRVAKATALVAPISSIAIQVCFLAVLGVGGLRVASGALTVAALVSFIMFLFLLIMPLGQLFGTITAIGEALGGAKRIAEILNVPGENDNPDATVSPSRARSGTAIVEFDRVDFAYGSNGTNDESVQTLSEVSFRIEHGQKVAIVGPSGAGKTTILNLIARFYDPGCGVVFFDGDDTNHISRSAVRSRLAYVEQGAPTISGTVRDNLIVNAKDASDARLRESLAELGLLDVVERSPDSLDTEVGEGGVLLSGGQRQRLALARVLLSNPDLLLLDESTSNLDSINEEHIQYLFDQYATNCARVIVAHRLSTVVNADLILVLENGRITAQGTHASLLESSPTYRALARGQLIGPT